MLTAVFLFVDLSKAFGSLPIKLLCDGYENDISDLYISAVKNINGHNLSRVKDKEILSDPLEIN